MQRLARSGLFKPRGFSFSRIMSSYPTSIRPSQDEVRNRQLTPRNLEIAIRSLYHDGLVVVEDAIPHDALDHLNAKMVQDARSLQSKKENSPYNYNPGNIQQDPPPIREYSDTNIFLSMYSVQHPTMTPSNSIRPHRHTNHHDCIRPPAQMDILLGKLSDATDRRTSPNVATRAFRCRFRPPDAPFRLRGEYPAHHDDAQERLHGAMARNA